MADIEKAIRILEGNYKSFVLRHNGELLTVNELIALLKAQEAVKPRVGHDGWYRCGGCNNSLASGERVNSDGFLAHPWPHYCEECGKKVRWG